MQTERPAAANTVAATLRTAAFMGAHYEYVVEAGGMRLLVKAIVEQRIPVGEAVWLTLPPERCCVVQADAQPRAARP